MGLARFWNDIRGGVAPFLALSAFPLVSFAGAAIDYSHANSVKASLQAAADSTALAISKSAASLSSTDLQNQATAYFNAVFKRTDAQNATLSVSYSAQSGNALVLTASASVQTNFMSLIGYSSLDISASATVKWGVSRLRVALVLDNTGSMSQYNKMTALKSATQNLLTQLRNAATQDGDVYVSIVPFSKDVNVGATNYDQTWINWSGATDTWDENNGVCSKSKYTKKSTCTANGGAWTPNNHNTWNGCVMDRDQNYDTTNTPPTTGSTLFPAEQYASCPVPLLGLTSDWTALSNKVNAMQPAGNTNQAIGLQWGFQSLTSAPFTIPPMDPNYQYQQVIILLTDGLNTQDRWYTSQSSIDARQRKTCDNIKAAGITLYTVQVNTDGDPTSSLLQYCASGADKFFLLTSSNQIVTTFNQIGTNLTKLHLAQ
jgi:Flp pilus assembly protein TadG